MGATGTFTVSATNAVTGAAALDVGSPLINGGFRTSQAGNQNGTVILTGSNNGVASVWDFDPQRWEATACRLAGRNLTRAEWTQYLPGRTYHASCSQWPDGR